MVSSSDNQRNVSVVLGNPKKIILPHNNHKIKNNVICFRAKMFKSFVFSYVYPFVYVGCRTNTSLKIPQLR